MVQSLRNWDRPLTHCTQEDGFRRCYTIVRLPTHCLMYSWNRQQALQLLPWSLTGIIATVTTVLHMTELGISKFAWAQFTGYSSNPLLSSEIVDLNMNPIKVYGGEMLKKLVQEISKANS